MTSTVTRVLCVVLLVFAFGATCVKCNDAVNDGWLSHFGTTPTGGQDYCCCSTDDVNYQSPNLLAVLDSIVKRPFFRYLRVNVNKPCPYYHVALLCQSANSPCTVCKCDSDAIPQALRTDGDMSELPPDYTDEPLLGRSSVPKSVAQWGHSIFEGMLDDHHNDGAGSEYVDLVKNPEGHTGYVGPLAHRIWEGVYRENCMFEGEHCSEHLLFYKLVSGLHASISTHIALTWNRFDSTVAAVVTNCTELRRRVLDHPDRVDNVYMLYQFVLRAMTRAADVFTRDMTVYDTGDPEADAALKDEIGKLFQVKLLCSNTFNESALLSHPESRGLVAEMRRKMRNVTTLTDCITCEKCRVWGKLQILGLATALKVVTHPADAEISLARNEMVALVNLLRQLTVTVEGLRTQCVLPLVDANSASMQQQQHDALKAGGRDEL